MSGVKQVRKFEVYSSAVDLLNEILNYSYLNRCSDIHIEHMGTYFRVRLRKNSSLFIYKEINKSIYDELVVRVKILSNIDIAEKRKPLDGRFSFENDRGKVDIRVSTIPTINGEKLVLRLLDPLGLKHSFIDMGMNRKQIAIVNKLLRQPQGLVLLCGPTGSGKTSTLYSFLRVLNNTERNIITIEDPVEYKIPGVNQIQVNPKAGISFESGLVSMLRQDPEILMVGEIRNLETAEIALRSSITGHLIFSTLHANDSPSAILRLVDMGVQPYMVSAGVLAVISQRLVRILCPKCKEKIITEDEFFGIHGEETYKPVGCKDCEKGYIGRKAVFEMLVVDDAIRNSIRGEMEINNIRSLARMQGMSSLKDNLLSLILSGEISLLEAYRSIVTI